MIPGFPAINIGFERYEGKNLEKRKCQKIELPLSIDLIKMTIKYMNGSDTINFIEILGLEENIKFISGITIKDKYLTDNDLENLAHWNHLTYLDLSESSITDIGLKKFATIPKPSFIELNLSKCNLITDDGIRNLYKLTNIRKLNLLGTAIRDYSFHILDSLNHLNELDITNCKHITEQGYRLLEFLQRVNSGTRLIKLYTSNNNNSITKILEKLEPFTKILN